MLRRFPLLLFVLGLLASGCQEKPAPASLFGGASDVKVLEASFVSSNDAAAGLVGGMAQSYLIFRVHLTNDISQQLFVVPSHFVFTTQDGNRYAGIDSGSSALIGISNDYSPLSRGQSRDFIVAFRMPIEQAGTISYEY
ncbi:MAG: hypothetical protein ACRENA_09090 [Vulcanimicrobiaceae bacterium]